MMMVRVDLENSIEKISKRGSLSGSFSDLETQPLSPVVLETRNLDVLPRPFSLALKQPPADRVREGGSLITNLIFASNPLPRKYRPSPAVTPASNPIPSKYQNSEYQNPH
ncbi:hypothetical protein D9757_014906 [Collybiopsis confluens]|uniref:Uncharacterized protein n=1 Tax=Collybiopsis confluens TaxID=2823264 RepID=A0A8H5CJC6_9AGAR|nr:hypothetical protein D9757_014906 [Collybiopsis confluens]